MKLLIASDIHGSFYWCEKLLSYFQRSGAEKLVLLGDLLYHGPRNPFPDGYDTVKVYEALNAVKGKLLCVRGNCDSEVDQMVLSFPMLADYSVLPYGKRTLFFTHGHLFNETVLPPLQQGDVLFNGHFHTPKHALLANGVVYVNDGSVALPKEGTPHSFLLFEDGVLSWIDLATGEPFDELKL